MEYLIVPAIIAKTQRELRTLLQRVQNKVRRVQLDVMDGVFVPNTSLNFDFKLPDGFQYEAHLMVQNPLEWVDEYSSEVDFITMHVESLTDVSSAIDFVKKAKTKVSLALIPQTNITTITPYLPTIDGVLIMTVEPGSYCIKKEFRAEPLTKIVELRKQNQTIPIEVDGCMNPQNVRLAKNAGANVFASGSYLFKSPNLEKALEDLEAVLIP